MNSLIIDYCARKSFSYFLLFYKIIKQFFMTKNGDIACSELKSNYYLRCNLVTVANQRTHIHIHI